MFTSTTARGRARQTKAEAEAAMAARLLGRVGTVQGVSYGKGGMGGTRQYQVELDGGDLTLTLALTLAPSPSPSLSLSLSLTRWSSMAEMSSTLDWQS